MEQAGVVLWFILWVLIGGFVGSAIGKTKGRPEACGLLEAPRCAGVEGGAGEFEERWAPSERNGEPRRFHGCSTRRVMSPTVR